MLTVVCHFSMSFLEKLRFFEDNIRYKKYLERLRGDDGHH